MRHAAAHPVPPPASGQAGPLRLRQLCLAAPLLAPAVQGLQDGLGLAVAFRDPNLIRFGLENAILPIGPHQFIEVVAPVQPDTAVGRFLARGGGEAPGAYMLIFDCPDPEPFRARAAELGIRVVHETRYANYHGVQLHPRDTGAVMLELCHTTGGEALDGPYYPAGPDWQRHVVDNGITGMGQVQVQSPVVAELQSRWLRLLEEADGASRGSRMRLALGELLFEPGSTEAVTEVRLTGPRAADCRVAGVRFVSLGA